MEQHTQDRRRTISRYLRRVSAVMLAASGVTAVADVVLRETLQDDNAGLLVASVVAMEGPALYVASELVDRSEKNE